MAIPRSIPMTVKNGRSIKQDIGRTYLPSQMLEQTQFATFQRAACGMVILGTKRYINSAHLSLSTKVLDGI
jgi:hypothetical protein